MGVPCSGHSLAFYGTGGKEGFVYKNMYVYGFPPLYWVRFVGLWCCLHRGEGGGVVQATDDATRVVFARNVATAAACHRCRARGCLLCAQMVSSFYSYCRVCVRVYVRSQSIGGVCLTRPLAPTRRGTWLQPCPAAFEETFPLPIRSSLVVLLGLKNCHAAFEEVFPLPIRLSLVVVLLGLKICADCRSWAVWACLVWDTC